MDIKTISRKLTNKVDRFLDKVVDTSTTDGSAYIKSLKKDNGFYGHYDPNSMRNNKIKTTGHC